MTAVEWLANELFKQLTGEPDKISLKEVLEQAKQLEKQQQGYSEEEVKNIINDYCFDWNYNYKGELSQKKYLVEWFEQFKNK